MVYGTFTLTGKHQLLDGTAHAGTARIVCNTVLRDAAGDVILAGPLTVALDGAGSWSKVLPAADVSLQPQPHGYTVTMRLHGGSVLPVTFAAPAPGTVLALADIASTVLPPVLVPNGATSQDVAVVNAAVVAEAVTARAAEASKTTPAAAATAAAALILAEHDAALAAANSTYGRALTQTPLKTAAYTAAANEFVICSATGGPFTVTLPLAPPDGTVVRVNNTLTGIVTVAPQAPDTIVGWSSDKLTTVNQDRAYTYRATSGQWLIGASNLPRVYMQPSITSQYGPPAGNAGRCMVIGQQITTGSADDGVHDLELIVGNNPGIGDADIYVERDTTNTTGVFYVHMPIRSMHGLQIIDSGGNVNMEFDQIGGAVRVPGSLVGGATANKDLELHPGLATGAVRFRKNDGTTLLMTLDNNGNLSFNVVSTVILLNTGTLRLTMAAGGNGSISSNASNQVVLTSGTGGFKFVNAAGTVQTLALSDAGHLNLCDPGNIILGAVTGTKIGTAVGQKLGFWGKTPVVQQARPTDAATIITLLTTLGLCA